MRAEVVIASVIALAGLLAAGQAVSRGLEDPPPPPEVVDPASTRCADAYEPLPGRERRLDITVVGDRVTAAPAASSWMTYVSGHGVRVTSSFVDGDARARDLVSLVEPSEADVLVVAVGTNDLDYGPVGDEIELSLQRIAERVGVPEVLISSIPPVSGQPQKTADYNDLLARIAYRHDWSFVDAGSVVVADDCRYRKGLGDDEGRPTAEGARLIGEAVRGVLTTRRDLVPAAH